MVTDGEAPLNAPLTTATTPLLATSRVLAKDLFPIHTWQPRAGRDEHFPRWRTDVRQLHAAFGITEAQLVGAVKYFTKLRQGTTAISIEEAQSTRASVERAAEQDKLWSGWQSINTAIYWHVLPSIDIETAHRLRDQRKIDSLYNGHLADGVGLLTWLESFIDASGPRTQKTLRRAIGQAKLPANATRTKLNQHAEQMYQVWTLITGNDPDNIESLADYWGELLESMPVAPEGEQGQMLVALRTWLVGQIAVLDDRAMARLSPYATYDGGMDAVLKQAQLYGLHAGSAVSSPALVFMGADGTLVHDLCGLCEPAAPSPGINALAETAPVVHRSVNKCGFCSSWFCHSSDTGGPSTCICRWNSTYNVDANEEIGLGAKRFIRAARKWHEANKNAATMKGVKFTISINAPSTSGGRGKGNRTGGGRGQGRGGAAAGGSVSAIASMRQLLGAEGTDDEFDAWLASMGGDDSALMALGSATDVELCIRGDVIVEEPAMPAPTPPATDPNDAASLGAAAGTLLAVTTMDSVEDQLAVSEARNERLQRALDSACAPVSIGADGIVAALAAPDFVSRALSAAGRTVAALASGGDTSPQLTSPTVLPTPPTRRSNDNGDERNSMSVNEHLASAALLEAKELRKLAVASKKTTTTVGSVATTIVAKVKAMSVPQWATIVLAWQIVAPWLKPAARRILEDVIQYLLTRLGSTLKGARKPLLNMAGKLLTAIQQLCAKVKPAATIALSKCAAAYTERTAASLEQPATDCISQDSVAVSERGSFSSAIDEHASTLNMMSRKRNAPSPTVAEEEGFIGHDTEGAKLIICASIQSMVRSKNGVLTNTNSMWKDPNLISSLTMLAPLLGVFRMQPTTVAAIGAALGYRMWYSSDSVQAVQELCGGTSRRSMMRHNASLRLVLERIATSEGIGVDRLWQQLVVQALDEDSCMSARLAAARQDEYSDDEAEPHSDTQEHVPCDGSDTAEPVYIGTLMGLTGNPDKPVALRLTLPTAGVLMHLACVARRQAVPRNEVAVEDLLSSIIDGLTDCDDWAYACDYRSEEERTQPDQDWVHPGGYRPSEELTAFFAGGDILADSLGLSLDLPGDVCGMSHHVLLPVGELEEPPETLMLALPAKDVNALQGFVPALCDNGASFDVSCSNTLDGAVLSTKQSTSGNLTVASNDAGLESHGSYIFIHERYGSDGTGEIVPRRMQYTPNLPFKIVISEPTEVFRHGYTFYMNASGRVMINSAGVRIPLWMSKSKLGWLKARPVTDPNVVARVLSDESAMRTVVVIGEGEQRSVGMPTQRFGSLRGVELLRHEHVRNGHLTLRLLLILLKSLGLPEGYITKADVETFIKEGCGACESTKMKRRPFTLKMPPVDTTPPPPGKVWICDELILEVPSADHGWTAIFVAICKSTDFSWQSGMLGQSAEHVSTAHRQLRAFVRPTHGDIYIVRKDSLPGHRAVAHVKDLAALDMHGQLSPPGVHEGVHKAENFLLHVVPVACALLLTSPDLGEPHLATAMRTAGATRNYAPVGAHSPPSTPAMRYHCKTEWIVSPVQVYGAAVKASLHPEFRKGHADIKAIAGVYTGPALNSDSLLHCSIWDGNRYFDADLGCVNIDDRLIVQRSKRTDASHQPFNQVGTAPVVKINTDVWYDAKRDRHPYEQATQTAAVDGGALDAPLPRVGGHIWLSHSPVPTVSFSVGIGSGASRPGDFASYVDQHTAGSHMHIRIDECIGGYEHRLDRIEVHKDLMQLLSHARCDGCFLQPRCGDWSAARFMPGKPQPIFRKHWEDGVLTADGELHPSAASAMEMARRSVELARCVLSRNKLLLVEHPAGQGIASLQSSPGLEDHTTMYDTSPFVSLVAEYNLVSVYSDLHMSGHDKRKTAHFLADTVLAPSLREEIGTLRVPKGWVSSTPPLQGKDEDGHYRTAQSEVYPPLLCERLSSAWKRALAVLHVKEGGANAASPPVPATVNAASQHQSSGQAAYNGGVAQSHAVSQGVGDQTPSAPAMPKHAVGSRVQVYWYKDKAWYDGIVVAHGTSSTIIKGQRMNVPDIQVAYDDGVTLTHMLHAASIRSGLLLVLSQDGYEDGACSIRGDDDDAPTLASILGDRHENLKHGLSMAKRVLFSIVKEQNEHKGAAHTEIKKALAAKERETDAALETEQCGVNSQAGDILIITDLQFDIEENLLRNKSSIFLVSNEGKLLAAQALDKAHARHWHTPTNEREYKQSPQRDLWRTAKELKWDKYLALNMFEWVHVDDIDLKQHAIYSTLWAYKIKFEEGLKFSKLNPRWCLKGGTMDRDKFKAHAETLRITSYRIILACKGGYWEAFCEFLLDCSDAFQSTRTDDVPVDQQVPLYCWPAPGFERRTTDGKRMACKVNVAMQGRIDATLLFNTKLFDLLIHKAGMTRLMWDKQVAVYHIGPLTKTTASLTEILLAIKSATDSAPQQPPVGYAILGWHVDDALGLACSVGWNRDMATNRVIQYIKGTIEVLYATTCTGWHGNKSLGYTLTLDEENQRVTMSARDTLEQLGKDMLKGVVQVSPKHVVTSEFYDIPPGIMPGEGDPERERVVAEMSLARHGLGTLIWTNQAHMEAMPGNNELCSNMAFPSDLTLKCVRHQLMHLLAFSKGVSYGKKGSFGLEQPANVDLKNPYGADKFMFWHFFADANLRTRSTTGGVGMLAGGCIQPVAQRQHLSAPGSHTVEVVGAGTNFSLIVPVNGVLQELHIRQGVPLPFYLDSSTTVFVATSDTAVKKSVWLVRRVAVLEDGVTHGEINPIHLTERDMAADPFTKYLTYPVWSRHMHYVLNRLGLLPPYPGRSAVVQ